MSLGTSCLSSVHCSITSAEMHRPFSFQKVFHVFCCATDVSIYFAPTCRRICRDPLLLPSQLMGKVTSISTKEPSCSYPKLSASDVILKAEELRNTKQTLEEVLSRLTGKPLARTSECNKINKLISGWVALPPSKRF